MMHTPKFKRTGYLNWSFLLLLVASVCRYADCIAATDAAESSEMSDSLVSAGNIHYMNREYELAAECYRKVIGLGYVSGELYYNLGNSYYKLDSISKAILYFEKALQIKPGDEDIGQNLAIANSRIIDKIDNLPVFFLRRWISDIPGFFMPNQWAFISFVLFNLALVFFLWFIISSRYHTKRRAFVTGIVFMLAAILSILSMRSRTIKLHRSGYSIIMSASVSAKSSPDDQSTNVFVLHEGTKVMVLDSVQNWKEIRITDGNKGWVPDAVLEEI